MYIIRWFLGLAVVRSLTNPFCSQKRNTLIVKTSRPRACYICKCPGIRVSHAFLSAGVVDNMLRVQGLRAKLQDKNTPAVYVRSYRDEVLHFQVKYYP